MEKLSYRRHRFPATVIQQAVWLYFRFALSYRENLALLRKLALNLAKLEPTKGSMRGKLKRAGWDNAFLANLLAQFANSQMR